MLSIEPSPWHPPPDGIELLRARRDETTPERISPEDFRARCRHALDILKSDASMDEKAAISHALIERVWVNSRDKEIKIVFYG